MGVGELRRLLGAEVMDSESGEVVKEKIANVVLVTQVEFPNDEYLFRRPRFIL